MKRTRRVRHRMMALLLAVVFCLSQPALISAVYGGTEADYDGEEADYAGTEADYAGTEADYDEAGTAYDETGTAYGGTEAVYEMSFRTSEVTLHCFNEYEISDLVQGVPSADFKLYSDNRAVASISKLGRIMTFEEGDCTVTALYDDGHVEECLVHVTPGATDRVRIALTFDDGPGKYSEDLLDFLASRGVKVTFFLVGNRVRGGADTVRRMYEEGHELGNHTYSHVKLSTLETAKEIANEVRDCNKEIERYTGYTPTVVRPPYGGHNSLVDKNVGLPMVTWSIDTRDWEFRDPVYVCNRIVEGATDGAIILCHEVHETTIEGAKMAIDILLAQGVEFMTVTDLLTEDGRTLKAGKLYARR